VSLIGVDEARNRLGEMVGVARDALAPFGEDAATLIAAAHFVAERKH
jgi:farnesyl diphosphate synthase